MSNYVVTELGLAYATDLDNHGQIVGVGASADGTPTHAALWQNGLAIDLGALGPGASSSAEAISDAGHVVGTSTLTFTSSERHAFLITPEDTDQDGHPDRWFRDSNSDGRNDLMADLGTPGTAGSSARDVNAFGQVVGVTYSGGPYPDTRAFVWSNGVMTDLGTLPSWAGSASTAWAINDAGQVLGSAGTPFLINPEDTNGDGAPDRWYRDADGDGANDLAVWLPLASDFALDLNASGQVVNYFPDYSYSYLWTPDTPNGTTGALRSLGMGGFALNASGQVAGERSDRDWGFAAVWDDGVVVDLNTRVTNPPPGLWLGSANAINDRGWILTTGLWGDRYDAPFLLTPDDQPPPPAPPALTIDDVSVVEGHTGSRAATFTVTLSPAAGVPVTVAFATAGGGASWATDFEATSGTLTFAPGETTKTIAVPVNGDRVGELTETFVVNLRPPTNVLIADGQGVGTIVDDEPRLSISDVTKAEGRTGQKALFTFTVTLSAAYDQAVTVSFRTADGSATSGNDYLAKVGTLTFAPGETTNTITIEVKGDGKREATETFYLDLFDNGGNALLLDGRGVATIVDDD